MIISHIDLLMDMVLAYMDKVVTINIQIIKIL
jgi:hypothetical protein